MKKWYEELFENYAEGYDNEHFTQGTLGECDFIESEINFDKSIRILDIGCGTGRHSIELAKRGYDVVGVDLSECQLEKARNKADSAGVSVEFRQADARDLQFNDEFDLAIMLCEGGFSLMETDEMNYAILQGAARSLKPGGKFIFTCLNGLFPLFHSVKEFMDKFAAEADAGNSNAGYDMQKFDLMTFRQKQKIKFSDDSGVEKELACNERFYVPSEISWQLKSLGMAEIDILGSKLGAYSRNDKLRTDDYEMLIVCKRGLQTK